MAYFHISVSKASSFETTCKWQRKFVPWKEGKNERKHFQAEMKDDNSKADIKK